MATSIFPASQQKAQLQSPETGRGNKRIGTSDVALVLRSYHRHGDRRQNVGDDGFRSDFAQPTFGFQDHAMAENGRRDNFYVIGQYKISASYCRERLTGPVQRNRCAWTATQAQVFVVSRQLHNLQNVLADFGIDVNRSNGLLCCDDFFCGNDRLQRVDRVPKLLRGEHFQFIFHIWIAQAELHHETVELGLGQGKRSFMVDWILGGNQQERSGQRVRHAVDCDSTLGHGFEHRGLCSRRRAIDFVSENDVRKQRAGSKLELSRLLVKDRGAGHIARQKIRRALDSLEFAPDASGKCPSQHRLGHSRNVFEQNVSFAQPGYERINKLLAFANDDEFDVLNEAFGKFLDRFHDFKDDVGMDHYRSVYTTLTSMACPIGRFCRFRVARP